jgi:ribosomal protein S4
MRFKSKYKGFNKLTETFDKFPLRVLKFKSTKWEKVKKKVNKRIRYVRQNNWSVDSKKIKSSRKKNIYFSKENSKHFLMLRKRQKCVSPLKKFKNKKNSYRQKPKSYVNNLLIEVKLKYWYRVDSYYRNGRKIKSMISNSFDNAISTSYFRKTLVLSKKSLITNEVYSRTLARPEFRLDILLWKLQFFVSSFQASQAVSERKISVNGKFVLGNYYLTKGDIVMLTSRYNLKNVYGKQSVLAFSSSKKVSAFAEVDYYSNSVVILKNVEDLGQEDLYLLLRSPYSLKKIKDYI